MKLKYVNEIRKLEELSKEMQGVFSSRDLETLFRVQSRATFFNILRSLQDLKIITKVKRGLYVTADFNPYMLSARIDPNSYLSLGTVLSMNGLIGTIPARRISAVRIGRNRTYSTSLLKVKHYGISPSLYFGFTEQGGVKVADNEKAFIDVLYYRMKGSKFVFNPTSDVDLNRLSCKKINTYLEKYKNKRFVAYCKDLFND